MREGVDRGAAPLGRDGETACPACEAGRIRVVVGVADMPGASARSGDGRRPCPTPFGSRFRHFRVTRARGAWQTAWFALVAGLALLFSAGAARAQTDTTAPTLLSVGAISNDGTVISLWFNEPLDTNSVPGTSAFRVTSNGVNLEVVSVDLDVPRVTGAVELTVSPRVPSGARYTVTYSPPTTNSLKDEEGNAVAAFTATYGTPNPPPPPPNPGGGSGGGGGGGGSRRKAPDPPQNLTAVGGDGEVVLSWEPPEDDGNSAISDYEYRLYRRTAWISTGSTDTTYTVAGLDNGATYVFDVRALNRIGHSQPSNRVEATPMAPEPDVFTLDFAHFANGGGITSEVVLLNVGTTPIQPVLYFSDQQGASIDAASVVEATDDLEVADDGGLMVQAAMNPLGERTISTHGRGELVSGSVQVLAEDMIGGVLRYGVPGVGVTGVGSGAPVRDALFPARRQQGGIRTAAALHNLGEEAIELTCRLLSGGEVLEETAIPLEGNGQTSWFLEEAFPETDTTDFAGTVRCTAPREGPEERRFTGLAVEVDGANRIFTTLPVAAVERTAGEDGPTVLHFAHFANGGNPDEQGIRSELVFVNVQTEASRPATLFSRAIPASRPEIYFYDQQGRKIDPESVVDVAGDLEVTEDGGLTVGTEMAPLGGLTIETHGRGAAVSGSVKVVSEGAIGGVLRYRVPGVGVTGVGAGAAVRDALFPARRKEGGIRTAAALRNVGEEAIELTCRLMSGGEVLEEAAIPLAGNGQTSWFIEETFTATDTTDFAGAVRCTAPRGGSEEKRFTGLAVEVDAANRIFTTLPVVPLEERMPRE